MKKTNFGWREIKDIKELSRGDIVRHKREANSYIIDASYGERATAVRTIDVTNPIEWEVLHI